MEYRFICNFIAIGIIHFGLVVIAGCSAVPKSVQTEVELTAVKANIRNIAVVKSGAGSSYRFEDHLLNISASFKTHSIDIKARNRTNRQLRVIWNDMYIVDANNQAFPVANPEDSFLGLDKSKSIKVIPPGAFTRFRLKISSSGNLGISRPLFKISRHNKERAEIEARESIGKSLNANLVFEDVNGKKHSYRLIAVLRSVRVGDDTYN